MTDKSTVIVFLRKHKRDLVLILSLILVSAALLIAISLSAKSGSSVVVEIDGKHYATYSLDRDGEYAIGEGNILVIEQGKAYMKSADCPDETCVRTGKISKSGQTIVCLPNRVSVTVVSELVDDGGADLVS